VKPLQSGRAKTYSPPLHRNLWRAFALPALQLVPPLYAPKTKGNIIHESHEVTFSVVKGKNDKWETHNIASYTASNR